MKLTLVFGIEILGNEMTALNFSKIAVALLISASASAGGWISSGGELFRDAHNPWFIQNVKTVKYCVQHDGTSFSASEAKAIELIQRALQYWQNEFKNVNYMMDGWDPAVVMTARIGTQLFDLQPCDGKEDLKFQFGFGTLAKDQIEYLEGRPSPTTFDRIRNLVGISVRTDYDPVQLRGKGFVYIGSDRGPNMINVDGPPVNSSSNLAIHEVWSRSPRLFHVLVHELGHVFGLPHVSRGDFVVDGYPGVGTQTNFIRQIMGEKYPQSVVTVAVDPYLDAYDLQPFFLSPMRATTCRLSADVRQAFGLTSDYKCLDAFIKPMTSADTTVMVDLVAFGGVPLLPKTLGRLQAPVNAGPDSDYRGTMSFPIVVALSPQQKVFDPAKVYGAAIAAYRSDFLMLPMHWLGTKYDFFVMITPHRFDIVMQGKP